MPRRLNIRDGLLLFVFKTICIRTAVTAGMEVHTYIFMYGAPLQDSPRRGQYLQYTAGTAYWLDFLSAALFLHLPISFLMFALK